MRPILVAAEDERHLIVRRKCGLARQRQGGRKQERGNTGAETQMRRELSEAVAGLIGTVAKRKYQLEDPILPAADVVTLSRTGVETDFRGDVIDPHAPALSQA
jgi:hypothetical protein